MVKLFLSSRLVLLAVVLAFALLGLVGQVQAASNIGSGTEVTIATLENLLSTILNVTSGAGGKVVATIMMLCGIMMAMAGKMGMGVGVSGSGIATAFVPGMVQGTYGATLPLLAMEAGLELHFFLQVAVAGLYPLAAGMMFLADPVVWIPLALLVAADRGVRRLVCDGVQRLVGFGALPQAA